MLTSAYPFDGKNRDEVYQKVKSDRVDPNYRLLDRYWKNGALAKDFLAGCLNKDPSQRKSAEELM